MFHGSHIAFFETNADKLNMLYDKHRVPTKRQNLEQ